jgi:hypothetical protein
MDIGPCLLIQHPSGPRYMENPDFTKQASDHSAMLDGMFVEKVESGDVMKMRVPSF